MPGYGYGETGRRRPRSSSRSSSQAPEKRPRGTKKVKAKKRKRRRGEEALEDVSLRGSTAATPQQSSSRGSGGEKASADTVVVVDPEKDSMRKPAESRGTMQDPIVRRGAWRDEIETTQGAESDNDVAADVFVPMETDEEVERKLAESRARREALMAKWVNRGESHEGGGFFMPDTNTSMDAGDASESDGEVAQFFEERRKELESDNPKNQEALEDKKAVNRFILQCKAEHDGDMFQEDDDEQDALKRGVNQSAAISQTGASADDWNDKDGYYRAQISEVMDGRYRVVESMCGKGVFSNVVKAKDEQDKTLVAIKIMRCNDMMRKAAEKEVELLEKINRADKGNKKNVIRLLRTFLYRGHLCLVFECMWDNLRVALKKYTKDKGMSLRAIRAYTKQLLIGLRHIHRCGILHADVKPDNILITAGHNLVKICDLGSAMELTEIEPTPYLVSRFYRAPEICFGAKYGPPADTFAMGATLFELFTGKILFPGKSNNDMLRHFMELKGKFPHKMIKSGMNWRQHFDDNLDFKFVDKHPVTRKKITRTITDCSAKRSMLDLIMQRVGQEKQKSDNKEDQMYVKKAKQFADLLTQMTALDPDKRATPEDLLQHPFVNEGMPASKAAKDAKTQPPA
eukprot:CAMPEP_0171106756 /NCGR_PEP_ID=MMETSP0766_2-20121228/65450_1 /TAXON_ID=439317 /ORGANISM="Gambierdiscus australes, Strain CAWD 149" /LENGTH=628 /DNA_ID=CAMNT_0011567929 /DNA_START=136 /DNA_END=2022 /DNA_ORIENTATION=+